MSHSTANCAKHVAFCAGLIAFCKSDPTICKCSGRTGSVLGLRRVACAVERLGLTRGVTWGSAPSRVQLRTHDLPAAFSEATPRLCCVHGARCAWGDAMSHQRLARFRVTGPRVPRGPQAGRGLAAVNTAATPPSHNRLRAWGASQASSEAAPRPGRQHLTSERAGLAPRRPPRRAQCIPVGAQNSTTLRRSVD